jgi:hypothetical protein
MGMTGTDVALETAEIVLTTDELEKIPYAVGLERQALSLTMHPPWPPGIDPPPPGARVRGHEKLSDAWRYP